MKKINGKTMDLTENNLKELQMIFPEVFTDGKIDFEKLKLILGENIETSDEKYEFKWNGKNDAIKLAQTPSMGTLRPDKDSSKNWDNTENLYIEGDNLEVLKLLQKSYFGKIKMIYIDPPYNTGKDFVYKDNFRDNISNYKEITNQNNKANTESNGRYHTDWLNMMYPRLKLAKNLLSEDGVMFVSIDDYEMTNLKKICDEIFGEDNFIGTLIQDKRNSQNDAINMQKNHEYILVYRKSPLIINDKELPILINRTIEKKKLVKESDNSFYYKDSGLVMGGGDGGTLNDRPKLGYSIYYNPQTEDFLAVEDQDLELAKTSNIESEVYTPNKELLDEGYSIIRPSKNGGSLGRWKWSKEKFNSNKNLILISKTKEGYSVYRKKYVDPSLVYNEKNTYYIDLNKSTNTRSILEYNSSSGTLALKDALGKKVFDNPKNLNMIKYLISLYYKQEDITILDFFSGSSTTAHAVMSLNLEDNGNRKFIMVQLPEKITKANQTCNGKYENICEIGKERIRRAGERIISETENTNLDIGFKVFKLDDSNIKTWNPDYDELEKTLLDFEDNLKEDRTQEDLLYEVLLKLGHELTSDIDEIKINNKTIFKIENSLLVCLENDVDNEIIDYITKIDINKKELKIVFKESGFKSDKDKMNALENLKQFGIIDVRSV